MISRIEDECKLFLKFFLRILKKGLESAKLRDKLVFEKEEMKN